MAAGCGCKKSPLKMCGCGKKAPVKSTTNKTKLNNKNTKK